jgi:hypothetical protein
MVPVIIEEVYDTWFVAAVIVVPKTIAGIMRILVKVEED